MSWFWSSGGSGTITATVVTPGDRLGLDEHGQPLNRSWNAGRRNERTVSESLGYLKGILADGRVMPAEVECLARWIVANVEADAGWPLDELVARVERVMEDGVVTDEECREIADLFARITGGEGGPARDPYNYSTTLPLTDPPPHIQFEGWNFVFTGRFVYGTRSACERAVVERGGNCAADVSGRTDVLVIGQIGSVDWIQTNYGRKIQKAVENKRRGKGTLIISEEHWCRFL